MNEKSNSELTVGEFLAKFNAFSHDDRLIFGDDALTFSRTKLRGEGLVQVEFNEQVYKNDAGEIVVEDLTM